MTSAPNDVASLHNRLKEQSIFLSNYATQLLACGATTVRIEKNVSRIASAWNSHAEFSIFPSHIILNLWDEERTQSYSSIGRIKAGSVNFAIVNDLSRLATDVEERHYDIELARHYYEKSIIRPRMNRWLLLVLVGFANASFCYLFGGDWIAMAIVWFATVDGFFLKQRLSQYGWDFRAVTIVSACVSAIISCLGYAYGISSTPEVALATSVLFLVPGIPYGNAVNDMINGHYLCSLSRLAQAVTITVCLSVGLCLALLLTNINM